MKFTIISINDDRLAYKEDIRHRVGLEEEFVQAFNAYEEDPLEGIRERGLELKNWGNPKKGELGVWLSNYNAWSYCDMLGEPLVVFEDDAVPTTDFDARLAGIIEELPQDWDFVALWVPDNQRQDFLYNVDYNEGGDPTNFRGYLTPEKSIYRIENKSLLSLVYQGYGMVSLMYSPNGARKLVDLAHIRGIDGPVDCWVYQEAHKGNLNGYAPRPEHADIVTYDWSAESHVQQTERAL